MKKKLTLSLFLGTVVSIAALYLAFRSVPFAQLIGYLGTVNYYWAAPAVAVTLLTFVVRAIRWQVILGGRAAGIGFKQAFHPLMIGFMINCIFPGRAGEVARPIILSKKDKIPFSTGLATVAAERMFDIVLLIAFFALVLATVRMDADLVITYGQYRLDRSVLELIAAGMLKLCLLLAVGIILLSLEKVQNWIKAAILKLPALMIGAGPETRTKAKERVSLSLIRLVENFAAGFGLVKRPFKILVCLLLTVLIWYLSAFVYYLMALGCPGIQLTFLELSAVMIIVCFFIALPSAPGFWGIWEAGGVFALSLFAVPAKEAAGMTLLVHAVSVFPVIIVGMLSAVITGINIWRLTYAKAAPGADCG